MTMHTTVEREAATVVGHVAGVAALALVFAFVVMIIGVGIGVGFAGATVKVDLDAGPDAAGGGPP